MLIHKYTAATLAVILFSAMASSADEDGGGFPSEAYGVWDRGSSFSFTDYPFLRGLSFNTDWEDVELDQHREKRHGAGPDYHLSPNPNPRPHPDLGSRRG